MIRTPTQMEEDQINWLRLRTFGTVVDDVESLTGTWIVRPKFRLAKTGGKR